MALTVLAAYDITEDGHRARLAAILQSWGASYQIKIRTNKRLSSIYYQRSR
ncbi:hypothetical protein [Gordonia bronchialis]|uniref:hypothetical protein n=1 Tax=Gordonia bronchialis TaxID=2054 RepID=UPI0022706CF1|nr:hypothetical protein [Gordonia bronchialis]